MSDKAVVDRINAMINGFYLGEAYGKPYKFTVRGCTEPSQLYTGIESAQLFATLTAQSKTPDDLSIELTTVIKEIAERSAECQFLKHICAQPDWIMNPVKVAAATWEKSNRAYCAPVCVARVVAIAAKPHYSSMLSMIVELTNADPRCVLVSEVLAQTLMSLCKGCDSRGMFPAIVEAVFPDTSPYTHSAKEISAAVEGRVLSEVGIGGSQSIMHTLAVIMFVMKGIKYARDHNEKMSFKKTLMKIASVGGDAAINCAVAGALIGANYGSAVLPVDWIKILDADPVSTTVSTQPAEQSSVQSSVECNSVVIDMGLDESGDMIADPVASTTTAPAESTAESIVIDVGEVTDSSAEED